MASVYPENLPSCIWESAPNEFALAGHWDEIVMLAASVKAGVVAPSVGFN